jgi:hypothetical protein
MSLFGAIIRTVVNVGAVPVALAKDVLSLGNVAHHPDPTYTEQAIQRLKDEAND